MLLTADLGNTQSVFGIWDDKNLLDTCRLSTNSQLTSFELSFFLEAWLKKCIGDVKLEETITNFIYCSVVSHLNSEISECSKLLINKDAIAITHSKPLPFDFNYAGKTTLGADRIANTIAGIKHYGKNLIIADFGTAITFCLIKDGLYQGGAICPGLHASFSSLIKRTALLPDIALEKHEELPAKNTSDSLQAGMYIGFRGLVKEMIEALKSSSPLKNGQSYSLLATGGISEKLPFISEQFDIIDINLTLRGLMSYNNFIINKNVQK